jgi:hypothetical protein
MVRIYWSMSKAPIDEQWMSGDMVRLAPARYWDVHFLGIRWRSSLVRYRDDDDIPIISSAWTASCRAWILECWKRDACVWGSRHAIFALLVLKQDRV